MFWFILGFILAIIFSIINIFEDPDTANKQIKWFFKFLTFFEAAAFICLLLSTGIIYAFSNIENMETEIVYQYNLEAIDDKTFVYWGDENRLICLTEEGTIKTYNINYITVRVAREEEKPNIKRISYPKYNDWRDYLTFGTLEDDDIIITLPKGVYKPIT